eukprot:gene5202-8808_t
MNNIKVKKRIQQLFNQLNFQEKEHNFEINKENSSISYNKIIYLISILLSPIILKNKNRRTIQLIFFLFKISKDTRNEQTNFYKFLRILSYNLNMNSKFNLIIKYLPNLISIYQSKLNSMNRIHYFNMIEILISVSIMVSFSSLISIVYFKKLEESKINFCKIEMNLITQSLLMFESRNEYFPLKLEELIESGDLNKLKKDPWGDEYIYIPKINWILILESLKNKKEIEKRMIQKIELISNLISENNFNLSPLKLLTISNKIPIIFSLEL